MDRATQMLEDWLGKYKVLYEQYKDLHAPILSAVFTTLLSEELPPDFNTKVQLCRVWLSSALIFILGSSVMYMRPASNEEQNLYNSSNLCMSKRTKEEVSRMPKNDSFGALSKSYVA
eukprot:09325_6